MEQRSKKEGLLQFPRFGYFLHAGMLYTLGRLFFPRMIHREKELRARMRWVAIVSGLVLVVVIGSVIVYLQQRPEAGNFATPLEKQD
jgi:hypothetical protein